MGARKHLFLDYLVATLETYFLSRLEFGPKCLSDCDKCQNKASEGFWNMLVGYMRVSSTPDRQTTDLQRDAQIAAGVDERHMFEDKASGARRDRSDLAVALDYVRAGDCLVEWKLDRLGRPPPHLLEIVTGLEDREVGFRSLTEQMDTTTPQGAFLFSVFGALAQYERALARERIMACLEAARQPGRRGGRPRAIDTEKLEASISALDNGASKVAVCRNFGVKEATLYHALSGTT